MDNLYRLLIGRIFPAEREMVPEDNRLIRPLPGSHYTEEYLTPRHPDTMNQQDDILHHEMCVIWCVIQLQWKMT